VTGLTVTAHLSSPAIPASGPILLDGILTAGLGGKLGSCHPNKWADPTDIASAVEAGELPLARVRVGEDWWYCASQAIPRGREELRHLHKRIPQSLAERFTTTRNLNIATGPDKSLRIPQYLRPEWLAITWTCIGDPEGIADLLWRVGGVGKVATHGNGWVREWHLSSGHRIAPFQSITQEDPDPPPPYTVDDYATSLQLRHLPVERVPAIPPGRLQRRLLPLRPPYHTGYDADASRNRLCWQVPV